MATGTVEQQVLHQLGHGATRSHGGRILLLFLAIMGLGVGLCVYLFWSRVPGAKQVVQATMNRGWQQKDGYSEPEKAMGGAKPPAVDTAAQERQQILNELRAMQAKMAELEKRKTGTTVVQQTAQHSTTKPAEKRPAPMLYFTKEIQDKVDAVRDKEGEYILAPWATKIPCTIEPLMNSDVPGTFTAKVSSGVYDTETGQHLLVPQGATIGGNDHGETLLYGNERLPTVALGLTIGARTYDLGHAPVMDQLGTNGLTGEVDQHFWRLAGAVLIGGALRGGQQLIQGEIAQAGGSVGQVASGIATVGNQAAQQRVGRALDTRPTIRVFPGQQCTVLLTKELRLPAVWESSPPSSRGRGGRG